MNKPWIGYVSALLFLLAGVFQIAGGKILLGILFIVLSVASVLLNRYIQKNLKNNGGEN